MACYQKKKSIKHKEGSNGVTEKQKRCKTQKTNSKMAGVKLQNCVGG